MTERDESPNARGTTRRAVLLGAGAVGAAGLLAACGSDPPAPTPAPPRGAGGATGAAPTSASGGSTAGASAAIHTTDIPVGSAKIFREQTLVVTQPTAGTFKAFDATCKHQGCLVGQVSGATIICTCHGSKYNLDGSVAQGPTTAPLDPKHITVSGDTITLG